MADRIKVNGEMLNRWASQLGEVSSALNDALSILNGMGMTEEWWSKVGNLSSLKLTAAHQTVSLGNARNSVSGIKSALRTYQGISSQIGSKVRETSQRFDKAASDVDRVLNGLSEGSGADRGWAHGIIPGWINSPIIGPEKDHKWLEDYFKKHNKLIQKILDDWAKEQEQLHRRLINYLHYPSDMSTWTEAMKQKYAETLKDAKVHHNSDGSVIYQFGEAFVWLANGGVTTYDRSSSFTKLSETLEEYRAGGSYRKTEFERSISQIGMKGKFEFDDDTKKKLKDLESMWGKRDSKKNGYYDENGNLLEDQNKGVSTSRKMTLLELGVDASDGVAFRHGEKKIEGKYGEGEVSGDIGYAEYSAGIHGGLYRTEVEADGSTRRVFEPGVSAEIGGGIGLARGTAKGQLGGDNLNVHGEVEAKALYAEGEVKGELGIVDGKVAARVKGSIEAEAVSVGGKVGVNIGGIEGNVGGNVKVGIGAHADVGYHDGVVKVDIGAAVGVGADLNFELNVGGLVDNVVDGARNVAAKVGKSIGKLKFW